MDPSTIETLVGLLSGDPQRVSLAVDGLCLVALPIVVGWVVTAIRTRPRPVTARLQGPVRAYAVARRWVYRHRAAIVDSTPIALAVLVTVGRGLLALYLGLDPIEHAARGFGTALGAVGLNQTFRAPGRIRQAAADEGADVDAAGR